MSLLTDEEIEACAAGDDGSDDMAFARAIEAAILAKLASAELPEPNFIHPLDEKVHHKIDLFTADQLRQAYAQGAAAQLSDEPVATVQQYGEGVEAHLHSFFHIGTKLYTRREA